MVTVKQERTLTSYQCEAEEHLAEKHGPFGLDQMSKNELRQARINRIISE